MSLPQSPTRIYEACFVEMSKTLRTAQFYPITHPAFTRSLERSYLYLSQLLKRTGALDVTITKTQLIVAERKLGGNPQVLAFLAGELFRRRIKLLHLEPTVDLKDYSALFITLAKDANEIVAAGGPERVLAKAGARHLWANEIRFEATQISDLPEELGEDEPETPETQAMDELIEEQAPQQDPELTERLQRLARAQSRSELVQLTGEIVARARALADAGKPSGASLAMQVMTRMAQQARHNKPLVELLTKAIRAIATSRVVEFEVQRITRALGDSWKQHVETMTLVGPATIPYLLHALANNESRKARKRLIEALATFGDAAVEPAKLLLDDARWYVVRNGLTILGELGDASVAARMAEFLDHEHAKVRYAARVALRRVGGKEALAALLKATQKGEDADRRHAVAQLTFFAAQDVMPTILTLVEKAPPVVAEEALRVLSELDPPDMIPFLQATLANRGGVFRKRRAAILRRTAAELLCLRLPDTWDTLRAYAQDKDAEVRKWVARGVELMQHSRRRETALV